MASGGPQKDTITLKRTREPYIIRPATPSRWKDIVALFGERGACGGCWCMVWRLPHRDWVAGKGTRNRKALQRIVRDGGRPGVIAYSDGIPVGWCAVAPRADYVALGRSRVLAPIDDEPVWSISCLFVLKAFRRRGLSAVLLGAAVDLAAARGARVVEGYPVEPTMERTPDPFLWTGVPSAYRRAGFREAARRSRTRPIMRRAVRRR